MIYPGSLDPIKKTASIAVIFVFYFENFEHFTNVCIEFHFKIEDMDENLMSYDETHDEKIYH